MKKWLACLTAILLLLTTAMVTAVQEEGKDAPELYQDESELRTLVFSMDEAGLTHLKIQMHDEQETVLVRDHFPQHVFLDTYHDADDILMDYYGGMPEGPFDSTEVRLELHWFMTFRYDGEAWRLIDFTNGETWMARVAHGVYTFDDYYDPGPAWQWSIVYDDRLETVDFAKLAFLVELYTLQKPDRPSVLDDWEEAEERIYYINPLSWQVFHVDSDCFFASPDAVPLTEAEARHPRYKQFVACSSCMREEKRPETDSWAFAFSSVAEKAASSGGVYALPDESMISPEKLLGNVQAGLMRNLGLLRRAIVDESLFMIYYYPHAPQYGRPVYDVSLFREDYPSEESYGLSWLASLKLDAETLEILDESVSGAYRAQYGAPPWEKKGE